MTNGCRQRPGIGKISDHIVKLAGECAPGVAGDTRTPVRPVTNVTSGTIKGLTVANILVIDDEEGVRQVVAKVLEREGHDVVEASDGKVALSLMRDNLPDVVVCDLFMPEMDGVEVLRKLRRDYPQMSVVAISGGGYQGQVQLLDVAKTLGAVAVLKKPFELGELVAAVNRALGGEND
ncbi:MAG: response regulator [Gemmatimonadales bacterium]|jgi:CheY-like chemotaxis protein